MSSQKNISLINNHYVNENCVMNQYTLSIIIIRQNMCVYATNFLNLCGEQGSYKGIINFIMPLYDPIENTQGRARRGRQFPVAIEELNVKWIS